MRVTGRGVPSRVTFNSSTLWMRFTSDWKFAVLGYDISIKSSETFGMYIPKRLEKLNLIKLIQNLRGHNWIHSARMQQCTVTLNYIFKK